MTDILIDVLMRWVELYYLGYQFWGIVCGVSLLMIWVLRQSRLWGIFGWLAFLSALIPGGLLFGLPAMTEYLVGREVFLPVEHRYWFFGGLLAPFAVVVLAIRYGGHAWSAFTHLLTKPFGRQRDTRTDIRNVGDSLPGALAQAYDPRKYFDAKKGIFIGLNEKRRPLYIESVQWRKSHVQVLGTTGSGKGVAAGVLLFQAVQQGEAAIVIDPKNDEFLPHVLAQAARERGVLFVFLDLQASLAQWNPFQGKSEQEVEELLTAGFGMAEKGTDADFYRVEDRRVARRFAAFCAGKSGSLQQHFTEFYSQHHDLIDVAKKLYADLEELAATPCVQAEQGIDLPALMAAGAVIYVRGSTRNPRILKLQRIFLLACMQFIEARERDSARHIAIFMDEFKYVLSRPALEALGAIRDKRAHVMVAHQSLGDLQDCGGDLTPEAVIGGVVENCAIKLAYQVRDPDTAEWLSRLSGTILVDDETRIIERNIGLTETQTAQRTLRQAERPLVDTNQLLMLPERCAVLFGIGPAKFIFTSPIPVTKGGAPIAPTGEPPVKPRNSGHDSVAGGLLDVD